MEHAEKDLDLGNGNGLIVQVEKELKWKQDTETIEIVGKESIEIIEWSETIDIEKDHEAEKENTEDLHQKTSTMMIGNDINVMSENECESRKSTDMKEEEKEKELNLEEVEKESRMVEEEE